MKIKGILRPMVKKQFDKWHEQNEEKRRFKRMVQNKIREHREPYLEKLAEKQARLEVKKRYANFGQKRDWKKMLNGLAPAGTPNKGEQIMKQMEYAISGKKKV